MFEEFTNSIGILLAMSGIIGYLRAKVNDITDRLDRIEGRLDKMEKK